MSLLCPIDFRYGRPKMKGIFEEESRLQRLLDVEAALARAEAKVGLIPEPAASEITKKATTKRVTVKRVQEIEEETRHDLMAVVLALTEACDGDAGKYVHLGATSNDILDTATALQLRDAIRVVGEDLGELTNVLAGLASKHKRTVMLGRTHGQAAVPITFGLKPWRSSAPKSGICSARRSARSPKHSSRSGRSGAPRWRRRKTRSPRKTSARSLGSCGRS